MTHLIEIYGVQFRVLPIHFQPPTKLERAKDFLWDVLSGGAMPVKDIFEEATAGGIAVRTLKRAKLALGVISKKRPGRWDWELPPKKTKQNRR